MAGSRNEGYIGVEFKDAECAENAYSKVTEVIKNRRGVRSTDLTFHKKIGKKYIVFAHWKTPIEKALWKDFLLKQPGAIPQVKV